MIEAEIYFGKVKIEEVLAVRDRVMNELQSQLKEVTCDFSRDEEGYHAIVYDCNETIAVGRLVEIDRTYIVDHVYVNFEKRSMGFGDLVVKMLLDKAFRLGAIKVTTHANKDSIGFFKTIGFVEVDSSRADNAHEMFIQKEMIIKCKQ